jgi:signal transduction histidine kinase
MTDYGVAIVDSIAIGYPLGMESVSPVRRTEERMARMIALTRLATAAFVFIPILGWERLRYPQIAVLAAAAATAWSVFFFRRVWRRGSLADPPILWGDVLFCVVLMLAGSRSAQPYEQNVVTTELLPYGLVASAVLGFAMPLRPACVGGVAGLMAGWCLAVLPSVTLKLVSDMLGFALWYVVALLIAGQLRTAASATERAQAESERSLRLAEQARHREVLHRELHDYLLPVVEYVAAGRPVGDGLLMMARQGRDRARRLIDGRRDVESSPSFLLRVDDLVEMFARRGLLLTTVYRVHNDPAAELAEAVVAATREALENAHKHARSTEPVHLYVESTEARLRVVVRDRGMGFDPVATAVGGGLGMTFAALRRYGARCELESRRGVGTKVMITWSASA